MAERALVHGELQQEILRLEPGQKTLDIDLSSF